MPKNIGKSKLKLINVQFPPLSRSHLIILPAINTVVSNKKDESEAYCHIS